MDAELIAVTGATGAVGSRVARGLAERGARLRLVVRDLARAPRLDGAEVRAASGYGAGDEMRSALDGAGTLFLIPAAEAPDRAIRGPAGDGRVAAILRDDVAAAAVAALTTAGHDGATYDLTGPEAFSLAEAAALMSDLQGKPIRFEDETDEQAFASRAESGAPDWEVRGWVSSYQAIRDGSLAAVSPAVRDLTGRDPVSLAVYLSAR